MSQEFSPECLAPTAKTQGYDLEQACELFNINMEELVNPISKVGIDKFQLPHFGLTADDRTYISRQATQLDEMKTQLTDEYLDKWVWFEDGHSTAMKIIRRCSIESRKKWAIEWD